MRRKKALSTSFRQMVITRDNGRCRACGIGDVDSLECDHIVPESQGGKDTLGNMQTLCHTCNNRKGKTNVGELPILPPIEGFGDYSEVMQARKDFLIMVNDARQAEIDDLVKQARQWRQEGKKGWVIRNRLGKITSAGKVEKILQLTN
jgi:hypothetical protein